MTETNGRGDIKTIYEVVKELKGKSEKPSANPISDGDVNMLQTLTMWTTADINC